MRAFPGGLHDSDQKLDKFFVVKVDGCKALVSNVFGLMQQFQPVKGFVGFFERNVHFVREIGFAFGMFCFPYQRANGVPLRNTCLDNTNSFFSPYKYGSSGSIVETNLEKWENGPLKF